MPDEQKSAEEKLRLLGERLRAGAERIRPVPKKVIEDAQKPTQALEKSEAPDKELKRRRRRRPSR